MFEEVGRVHEQRALLFVGSIVHVEMCSKLSLKLIMSYRKKMTDTREYPQYFLSQRFEFFFELCFLIFVSIFQFRFCLLLTGT